MDYVTLVKGYFFFKFSSTEGVDSVLRDGPWMIRGVPIFLNKWSPSVSLLKEDLSHVPVWVKFHDVSFVAYTSDGLSLIATKIDTPMMLNSYTNSMCLESWGKSTYARILIEIDAYNYFSDNLVMAVPNLEGTGYTKETIRVEYEWKPPRCSMCLIFGHSLDDCPKAPKRVVNKMDKGKGGSSDADDEGFVEVKKKKSSGNNGGNKNFKPVSVNNRLKGRTKRRLLLLVSEEVKTGNKVSTSSVQEEGQSSTPLVEKINMFEKHLLEGECVLVNDDDKPQKSYLASKPSGIGYGTKSLPEQ
ncbi:zinc knuckle CX2CX4HX4C containing protein [Tanacetum coccineum]